MKWFFKTDKSKPVIMAEEHIKSGHKKLDFLTLPKTAIIFCMSKWDTIIKENFDVETITEALPRFLGRTPVYKIKNNDDFCFLHGGAGAPQMADTIETIHALGVKNAILVGMAGGFASNVNIGDVVIPSKILIEEGTSLHYGFKKWATANNKLNIADLQLLSKNFNVLLEKTITTDAVYRQTMFKEKLWAKLGCVCVDMEASAFTNICNYYNMQNCVFLRISDKHGVDKNSPKWQWGVKNNYRKEFIKSIIDFILSNKLF